MVVPVNTGVVDPLDEIADLAQQESIWFHVDAAYGGFFHFTDRGKKILHGISRADSITTDPHKGLFLPYGTGCLLVKNGEDLKDSHAVGAEYLPAMQSVEYAQDFCDYSPELSRDFRGLRVWLPFKIAGVRASQEALDEKLDLAQWVGARASGHPSTSSLGTAHQAEPRDVLVAKRCRTRTHQDATTIGPHQRQQTRLDQRFVAARQICRSALHTQLPNSSRSYARSHRHHPSRGRSAISLSGGGFSSIPVELELQDVLTAFHGDDLLRFAITNGLDQFASIGNLLVVPLEESCRRPSSQPELPMNPGVTLSRVTPSSPPIEHP